MLVLTRRLGEEIVIAGDIRVTVLALNRQKVRLGIMAPASVPVVRQELRDRAGKFAASSGIQANNEEQQ
jgi:carbon storage regulator